jgi:group I intron endonuclease
MPRAVRSMPISGVYAIHNTVSGRIYVGSSAGITQRWHIHRHKLRYGKHHSPAMQRSWTKHGPGAFSFRILELVGSPAELYVREQYWIDALHAACPRRGFNVLPNAGGPRGHKRTARSIAKQVAARKGKPLTPEHAANVRAALVQRNQTQEMRAKSSARATERNRPGPQPHCTPEFRLRMRSLHLGKVFSAETRAKMSVAAKARARTSARSVGGKFIASVLNDKSK